MKDASEDEQEDSLFIISTKGNASEKASKAEREERLRKMMDDEGSISRPIRRNYRGYQPRLTLVDEPMENALEETRQQEEVLKPASATASQEESLSEHPATVSGGRRRGRRKVMKRKMLKDDEGYLGKFSIVSIPLCETHTFTLSQSYVSILLRRTTGSVNFNRPLNHVRCSHQRRSSLGILLRGRAGRCTST